MKEARFVRFKKLSAEVEKLSASNNPKDVEARGYARGRLNDLAPKATLEINELLAISGGKLPSDANIKLALEQIKVGFGVQDNVNLFAAAVSLHERGKVDVFNTLLEAIKAGKLSQATIITGVRMAIDIGDGEALKAILAVDKELLKTPIHDNVLPLDYALLNPKHNVLYTLIESGAEFDRPHASLLVETADSIEKPHVLGILVAAKQHSFLESYLESERAQILSNYVDKMFAPLENGFYKAIELGDKRAIDILIEYDVTRYPDDSTLGKALERAAHNPNTSVDTFVYIMEHDKLKSSALVQTSIALKLQAAIASRKPQDVINLLNAGASINAAAQQDLVGATILLDKVMGDLSQEQKNDLLEMCFDLSTARATKGAPNTINKLIANGAIVSSKLMASIMDNELYTSNAKLFDSLIEVSPPITLKYLTNAIARGENELFAKLLNKLGDTPGDIELKSKALAYAIRENKEVAISALLSSGASSNAKIVDRAKFSQLAENKRLAARSEGTPILVQAIQDKKTSPATIKLLLNHKDIDVNLADYRGNTALMVAILEKDTDSAKTLLDKGADTNSVNKNGRTALMAAVYYGQVDMVRQLMLKGADIHTIDKFGHNMADYLGRAEKNGKLTERQSKEMVDLFKNYQAMEEKFEKEFSNKINEYIKSPSFKPEDLESKIEKTIGDVYPKSFATKVAPVKDIKITLSGIEQFFIGLKSILPGNTYAQLEAAEVASKVYKAISRSPELQSIMAEEKGKSFADTVAKAKESVESARTR